MTHADFVGTATSERLTEVGEILAAGLVRLQHRQSTPLLRNCGESSLDFAAYQSSHADGRQSDEGSST
jgi:hypothetical protein